MAQPLTLFQKVWNRHVVTQEPDSPAVLYIDLQLVHEVTSPQAFDGLRRRGLKVRRPDRTIGTMDHSIPTLPACITFHCRHDLIAVSLNGRFKLSQLLFPLLGGSGLHLPLMRLLQNKCARWK